MRSTIPLNRRASAGNTSTDCRSVCCNLCYGSIFAIGGHGATGRSCGDSAGPSGILAGRTRRRLPPSPKNQIENMGVARAEDFVYMTPGVTFVNSVEVGDSQLAIRGINGARDAETNFAFIVDGVLYTNPSAFNREYPDLAQIEVLKGPQGALYGRSAAAGAVIMSTKRPTQEMEGSIKVGAAEYGTMYGTATIAGPLGSDVAGRLTVTSRKTDGFLENVY